MPLSVFHLVSHPPQLGPPIFLFQPSPSFFSLILSLVQGLPHLLAYWLYSFEFQSTCHCQCNVIDNRLGNGSFGRDRFGKLVGGFWA